MPYDVDLVEECTIKVVPYDIDLVDECTVKAVSYDVDLVEVYCKGCLMM